MTGIIELRRSKSNKLRQPYARSIMLTTAETSSDSSDDDFSIFTTNFSKRNNTFQTLPVMLNTQSIRRKEKHTQPVFINTQQPPRRKEIVINQIIQPPCPRYLPISAPPAPFIEHEPFAYRRFRSPTCIEANPHAFYEPYETPVRRIVRTQSSDKKNVHLPKHAQALVSRFLNGLEHAHGCRQKRADGYDSDCSIGDCDVCSRLRSAMNVRKRRHGRRAASETQESCNHRHNHSKNCKVCDIIEKSDFHISTANDHSASYTKTRGKHVPIVDSASSNIKQPIETTTIQPNVVNNTIPSQLPVYPTTYSTYTDPYTGITSMCDPNWQYNQSETYNYPSYYNTPAYTQSNPQYGMTNIAVPIDPYDPTTTFASNPIMDKATHTRIASDNTKHKPSNKKVILPRSRNPTPPRREIVIEQPRRSHKLPRRIRSTTIVRERTSRTTYVRT